MLRIIDQNGIGLAMFECLLKDQAETSGICPSIPGEWILLNRLPGQCRHLSAVVDGVLNARFLQEEQRPLVVITPLELRQGGRDRIQLQGGDVTAAPVALCCHKVNQPSLNVRQQRGFSYPCWANDKNQRRSRWLTQCVPDCLICLCQGGMRDRICLEIVQAAFGWLLEQMTWEKRWLALLW